MEKVVENKTCEQKTKQQNPWAKNSHKRSWNLNNETWPNVNLNDINSKAFYWMHCTTFKGGANGSRDRENGKMFSASIYRFSFLHIYWLFICATFAAPIISREIWSVQLFGMLCVSGKYIVRLNVITVPMRLCCMTALFMQFLLNGSGGAWLWMRCHSKFCRQSTTLKFKFGWIKWFQNAALEITPRKNAHKYRRNDIKTAIMS